MLFSVQNMMVIDKDLDEKWASIPNYSNYLASNKGRVKHKNKNSIIMGTVIDYEFVTLVHDSGRKVRVVVHRVVYQAFNPDEDISGLVVNHIDGVKTNNCLENLEAVTQKENVDHALKMGLFLKSKRQYEYCDDVGHMVPMKKQVDKVCATDGWSF